MQEIWLLESVSSANPLCPGLQKIKKEEGWLSNDPEYSHLEVLRDFDKCRLGREVRIS